MKKKSITWVPLSILLVAITAIWCVSEPYEVYAETSKYSVMKNGVTIYTASGERNVACERMYQMSSVSWEIPKAVSYKYTSSKTVTLAAGKYKGLPYTQTNRDYSVPGKIQGYMNDAVNGNGPVKGVDCSSAAAYAIRYGTGNNVSGNTYLKGASSAYVGSCFLYDALRNDTGTAVTMSGTKITYRDHLDKVGWYGNYTGYANAKATDTVLKKLMLSGNYNAGTVYENVYAKVKPGDALVQYYKKADGTIAGHIMLATRVEIKYDGKYVDPDKSKIYFIDQISPGRSVYPTGESSSWRNDETISTKTGGRNNSFTFKQMTTVQYILPVTAWGDAADNTISYDVNGGTGAPPKQVKKQYSPVKLSNTAPVKEGYVFKGWQTTKDAVPAIYQPGEYYLEEHSEVFKAVWEPEHSEEYILYGDANGDSNINVKDAVLILQYANKKITADKIDIAASDVNGDGKVNVKDAVLVLQFANKKIDRFPAAM